MSLDSLIEDLAQDVAPTPKLPRSRSLVLRFCCLALALGGSLLMWHGLRPDYPEVFATVKFWLELGLLIATAGVAMLFALLNSIPGRIENSRSWLMWVGVLSGGYWLCLSLHAWPNFSELSSFFRQGYSCSIMMLLLALAPSFWLRRQVRKSAPTSPRWNGCLTLSAAFAVAAAIQQLICHKDEAPHLILWHAAPLVLAGLLGLAVGRRWYSW